MTKITWPLRLAAAAIILLSASALAGDPRSFMHGIEAVPAADGDAWVFFSSSGLPPQGAGKGGSWTHDVYRARWSKAEGKLGKPEIFIKNDEAQEPVSAARAASGNIMLSFEDGWNTDYLVNQRYGVYDKDLSPVAPYPRIVAKGGHSGHVAAAGNYFVVFYSEGWIKGGGVDNLGSGYGVYANIYDDTGRPLHSVNVARHRREWWPVVAASDQHALLVWQQFVPKQTWARLKLSLLDPASGRLLWRRSLNIKLQYYTYQAAWVPALNAFLVAGTGVDGKGFAVLLGKDGHLAAALPCMPPMIREAGIVVDGAMAYIPVEDNRLAHLDLSESSIRLKAVQASPLAWNTIGSVGLMRGFERLHWISLSKEGLQEADIDLREGREPTDKERCE